MGDSFLSDLISSVLRPAIHTLARTRLPRLDGEIRFAALHEPAEILRDRWGIPHIYAADLHDMLFVQGYIHAQDRLWQMEFNRRLVAGRLAEILGKAALSLDRWMRILTMRRVAEYETTLLGEETTQKLQWYANGVNAYLAQGKLPVENVLLRYKPEPWVISDTLAWVKMMAWTLSVNWEAELLRARLIARLGPEKAAELEPPYLSRWPFIVPPGVDYSQLNIKTPESARQARPFSGASPYEGLGSNNWVVDGRFSASGKPLLANDMHLLLSEPAIWYENHLVAGELDLYGVTFPGIPEIVAGHNGYVAWGYTDGLPDVQDLYIEHLRRQPDGSVEVEFNGAWEKARLLHEKILVRGAEPVVEEVIITRHGPIINQLAPQMCEDEMLALQWTALEPDTMIESVFHLDHARNIHDFHQGLRYWTTPTQNVVYADIHGDIGYTFAGKIPNRSKGSGKIPVPGWTDEYRWDTYIPFESLPHVENPPQGFIVTANNRVFDKNYTLHIDLEPLSGDRAQRVAEMILDADMRGGYEQVDLEFFKRMQFDLCSSSARVIARYIGQLQLEDSAHYAETGLHAVQKILRDWDHRLTADSAAAAIYEVFIRQLIWLILKDKLDPETGEEHTLGKQAGSQLKLTPYFMGKGPTPVLAELGLFGERWLAWLIDKLEDPDSNWFDLGGGEKRDDVLRRALGLTIEDLKKRLGPDMDRWAWGKLHKVTFSHALSANPMLGAVFNVGPFSAGGDHATVWATGARYHNLDTSIVIGPPFRMIVDLGDLKKSVAILAPGQSGNLASPHYRDQVRAWFKGEYHPMLIDRDEICMQAMHTLKFLPRQ